jgi:hypothetical protein
MDSPHPNPYAPPLRNNRYINSYKQITDHGTEKRKEDHVKDGK